MRRTDAPPPGLRYLEGFLSRAEERALAESLEGLAYGVAVLFGQPSKRQVAHFGWDYGYESWALGPAPPIPGFLLPLRERCAELLGQPAGALEEVLCSRYPPGAGIGWHRDAPLFGPAVVGLSAGAPCRMRFRKRVGDELLAYAQELAPGSAYVLAGEARTAWQHSIPAVKALRYSVSFRTLSERGRASAAPAGGEARGSS